MLIQKYLDEVDLTTTVTDAWEELVYDFSGAPAADYVKVVIFFDFDVAGDGSVYYFDDIQLRNTGTPPLVAEDFEGVAPNGGAFGNAGFGVAVLDDLPSGLGNVTQVLVCLIKRQELKLGLGYFLTYLP